MSIVNDSKFIKLANNEGLDEAYFSEGLTNFLMKYINDQSSFYQRTIDALCGAIPAPRRFQYREIGQASDLQVFTVGNDIRSVDAEFSFLESSGDIKLGQTDNKGYTIRCDEDIINSSPTWETDQVTNLYLWLQMTELQRAMTLLTDSATARTATWGTTTPRDADMDVYGWLNEAVSYNSFKPNVVYYGRDAWFRRINTLRAYNKYAVPPGPEELAKFLGVDKVIVSNIYTATNLVLLVCNYPYYKNVTQFYTNCVNGDRYRVFKTQHSPKFWDITVEHYSTFITTATQGLVAASISAS